MLTRATARESMKPVASDQFVTAISRFTSGVAVVTSRDGDRPVGVTVAAIAPIAYDPATVMVAISSTSSTAETILRAGTFAINILDEDAAELAGIFASRAEDRFAGVNISNDILGNPLLQGRIATLSCCVVDTIPTGSHREFRARVVDVESLEGLPLTYYGGAFALLTTEADRSILGAVRSKVLSLRSYAYEVLDPEQLARELGATRGAVLRALSGLKSEGLIERINGVHRVVAVPDTAVDAVYEAKLTVEIGAALQIIDRITDDDLHSLRALLEPIRRASPGGSAESVEDLVVALNDFAESFIRLAGSEPLVDAYRSLGLPGVDRRTITKAIFANIPPCGGFEDVLIGLERRDISMVLDALRAEKRKPAFVRRASHNLSQP